MKEIYQFRDKLIKFTLQLYKNNILMFEQHHNPNEYYFNLKNPIKQTTKPYPFKLTQPNKL